MIFLINMFNHSKLGQRSLEDVIAIFGHQLKALGHKVVWDQKNDQFTVTPGAYNVIVEGFTPFSIDAIARAWSQGARFICLATEEPTPKGFNHGLRREMVFRQRMFPRAMQYFDAILHLVPGKHVTDWYSQHAPTRQIELGYAPSLVRKDPYEPRYDFGFYGSLTKRRNRVLRHLANRTGSRSGIRMVADFTSQVERDRLMQEAKVILQIRTFDAVGLVSSSRCGTALCLGRPIVAEPHELSHPWDEVVKFTQTEDEFYDMASVTVAAWREVHADQFAKFKEKLSPERCVGAALESLGLERRRAA
jgi:hypothetical protein